MGEKRIIIISGCSSGFGMLTAQLLAEDPLNLVYATMRDPSKKRDLLDGYENFSNITVLKLDVEDRSSIQKSVREIVSKHNRVDILINNAGIAYGGFFEDLSEEEIRLQFEVNFFGLQNLTREVLKFMGKGSKIINISSIAGLVAYPFLGAYNSSKWALEGFTESLHLELAHLGISVSLVEPGSFNTNIFKSNARCAEGWKEGRYKDLSANIINTRLNKLENIRPHPIKVAKFIYKLSYKRKPPLRNLIGLDAWLTLFLKRILPYSIFSKLVNFFAFRKY